MNVRVGPVDIPIHIDPGFEDHGEYKDEPSPRVTLRRLETREDWLTLLHELLHAVDELQGLGLGERRVRALEMALGALWRDNPEIMARWAQEVTRDRPA